VLVAAQHYLIFFLTCQACDSTILCSVMYIFDHKPHLKSFNFLKNQKCAL